MKELEHYGQVVVARVGGPLLTCLLFRFHACSWGYDAIAYLFTA